MKINLEKVKELEKKYQNDKLTLSVIHSSINSVLTYPVDEYGSKKSNVVIAIATLKNLGILEEETEVKKPQPNVQQLNS